MQQITERAARLEPQVVHDGVHRIARVEIVVAGDAQLAKFLHRGVPLTHNFSR